MPIYWEEFTWQAFATFAAVAGATIVGLRQVSIADRQVRIADRQANIAGRQVALAELKLKDALFQKRFDVYEAGRKFFEIVAASSPTKEDQTDFLAALGKSRFLFSPGIHAALMEVWKQASIRWSLTGQVEADAATKELAQTWIEGRMKDYHLIFGEELGLVHDPPENDAA